MPALVRVAYSPPTKREDGMIGTAGQHGGSGKGLHRSARGLLFLALAVMTCSCAEVDVDEQRYACSSDSDCGDWSCVYDSQLGESVCMSASASTRDSGASLGGGSASGTPANGGGTRTTTTREGDALEACMTGICSQQLDACAEDGDCSSLFFCSQCGADDSNCILNTCVSTSTNSAAMALSSCIQNNC